MLGEGERDRGGGRGERGREFRFVKWCGPSLRTYPWAVRKTHHSFLHARRERERARERRERESEREREREQGGREKSVCVYVSNIFCRVNH
jgi:hypothetical protein